MKPITEFCQYIVDNNYHKLTVAEAKQYVNSDYIILRVAQYQYKFGYNKFNIADTHILIDFFNQYTKISKNGIIFNEKMVRYGYRIWNFFNILTRNIVLQLYKQDKLVQILSNVNNNYVLYDDLLLYQRQEMCIDFIKCNISDYEEINLFQPAIFPVIDYEIKNGSIENIPFESLVRKCSLIPNVIITPNFYKYMKFDDYKRRFKIIGNIIYNHYKYNLLSTDDYNKHLEYLIKTAIYKTTYIRDIEYVISFIKEIDIKNQLNSVIMLKQLQPR